MDTEEILVGLFRTLRHDLNSSSGIGLILRAEGRCLALRVRSRQRPDDEKRPYFAIAVEESDGMFRVSYKPSGIPATPGHVSIVDLNAPDDLLTLIRSHLESERLRLDEYLD